MTILFEYPPTRSQRAKWALEELGLDYESHIVDLTARDQDTAAYREVHPLGVVPAVRTDRYTMFESVAIVLQLIDEHPEFNLAPPPASAERALYYQWSIFAAAEVDPAIMTYFDNALRPLDSMRPPGTQHDAGLAEKGRRDFGVRAAMLSNALSGQDYMIGAEFSGADIIVGHSCFMASFTGLIGDYPVLDDYYRRLTARPAHKRAYAGIGPGGAAA